MVRLLIVEDDAAIRETLAAILRSKDVEVTLCCGAIEASKLIAGSEFDVIITDMRMETPTSGYDVIRAAGQSSTPPRVVVLTAYPLPRKHSLADGATAVLLKGADPGSLIRQIQNIVADVAARKPNSRTA